MVEYELPSTVNYTQGADTLLVYIAREVPIFFPMVLFCFFLVVMLAGYSSQKRTQGFSNLAMWSAVAGWLTSGLAILMTLTSGIINVFTLVITFVISFICTLWFMTSRREE